MSYILIRNTGYRFLGAVTEYLTSFTVNLKNNKVKSNKQEGVWVLIRGVGQVHPYFWEEGTLTDLSPSSLSVMTEIEKKIKIMSFLGEV